MGFCLFVFLLVGVIAYINLKSELDACIRDVSESLCELHKKINKLKYEIDNIKEQNISQETKPNLNTVSCESVSLEKDLASEAFSIKSDLIQDEFDVLELQKDVKQNSDKIEDEIEEKIEIIENHNNIDIETIKAQANNLQTETDLVSVFMGNLFNKIGAIALILGIIFFVILANEFINFTPQFVVSVAFIASIALMIKSLYSFKEENVKPIAHALCGVGLSGSLISVFAGTSLYSVFPIPVAFIISCALVCASYYIASVNNSYTTMLIGLLGAYLAPCFLNPEANINFIFSYLLFVNLISLVYMHFNSKRNYLNIINIVLSTIFILSKAESGEVIALLPILFWLMYFVNDIILILNQKYEKNCEITNWLNFVALILFSRFALKVTDLFAIGLLILLVSSFYLVVQILILRVNRQITPRIYFQNMLCGLFVSTYLMTNGALRVCAWAIEACLLIMLYNKYLFSEIKKYAIAFLLSSVMFIFLSGDIIYNFVEHSNYTSERIFLFLIPILSLLFFSGLSKSFEKKHIEVFKFLAVSLCYIFISLNLAYYLNSNAHIVYVYILLLIIYSLNLKLISKEWSSTFVFEVSKFLHFASVGIYVLALLFSFANSANNILPFLNFQFITGLILIAVVIYRKSANEGFLNQLPIYLGGLCLSSELKIIFDIFNIDNLNMSISILLVLYSFVFMLLGIFKRNKNFMLSGIVIVLFSMVKIMFVDLAGAELIVEFLTFLVLGACLMVISYFYKKYFLK